MIGVEGSTTCRPRGRDRGVRTWGGQGRFLLFPFGSRPPTSEGEGVGLWPPATQPRMHPQLLFRATWSRSLGGARAGTRTQWTLLLRASAESTEIPRELTDYDPLGLFFGSP